MRRGNGSGNVIKIASTNGLASPRATAIRIARREASSLVITVGCALTNEGNRRPPRREAPPVGVRVDRVVRHQVPLLCGEGGSDLSCVKPPTTTVPIPKTNNNMDTSEVLHAAHHQGFLRVNWFFLSSYR